MLCVRRLEILLIVAIVILGAFLARATYIPSWADRNVEIAAEKLNLDVGKPSQWFSAWSIGDGQAYAVIAADPTGGKLGEEIKEPAYRFSRAGFGWLAAAVTLGVEAWVPYGMAAVGLLAIVGLLVLAVSLRERLGPRAWLLVFNPAIYLGFAGDTSESLGVLFLAVAIASGSMWAAAVLGITRPTYLLALLGRLRLFRVGIAATALLGLYSLWRFGLEDLVPHGGRFDLPFRAYFENPSWAGFLLAGLALATIVVGVVKSDWTWALVGVFVLSFGPEVTLNPINAWRAAGMLPVMWAFGPGYWVVRDFRVAEMPAVEASA